MKTTKTKTKAWLRESLTFSLTVLCLFAARSSLADHYVVPSGSMERTLLPGDRVLVDKQAYGLRVPFTLVKLGADATPRRGDIVVFDSPTDGTRLIKRVVAVGGDRVEVRAGRVLIDGVAQEDAALPDLRFGGGPDLKPTRVPDGQLLMLGDSRGNSLDGRSFGFVPAREIYAKAVVVYYRSEEGSAWIPL
jgi:signal peptidase I